MKKRPKVEWPIVIRTRRLELRPYKLSDFEAWREALNRRNPKRHKFDTKPVSPKKTTRQWFRKMRVRHSRLVRQDKGYAWAVFDKRTGLHLGVIDISTIARDWYQSANLGYLIHNTCQNKGYGKEAARAAIKVAFRQLGYKRLEAAIDPGNWRSIKLARSLGMKREGVRKAYIFDNKMWEDQLVFSATNPRKSARSYPFL